MARPRLITDEQILRTMRDTVLEHGPHVSLEVVAEQLKVTSPALLKRFGSREELMLAALRPSESPPWMELVDKGPDARPFAQQLLEIFEAMEAFFSTAVPCVSALRESGIPWERVFPNQDAKALPVRAQKAMSRWLERARDKGLIEGEGLSVAAYAMIGALQHRAYTSHLVQQAKTPRSQHEFFKHLVALFSRALVRVPHSPKLKAIP
jgi:AcrR family transcriptional regulator